MEPEVIDPREQAYYDDWERKRKDYADFAANAPVQEKPGLWRTLAAIGAGAFGGSQYDKGGMQWGQNIAKEITEGPYQRKMNEHLKMLAAKRMGLDVAQEGMQVMGNIANNKANAAMRKQQGEEALELKKDRIRLNEEREQQKFEATLAQQTKNNFVPFNSIEELEAAKKSDPRLANWETRAPVVTGGARPARLYLAEPASARQERERFEIKTSVDQYNRLAPKFNLPLIDDPGKVTKEHAAQLDKRVHELWVAQTNQDAEAGRDRRTMAMINSRGGDDEGKAARADEVRKHKETAAITKQFAALKAAKENQYLDKISYARAQGNEALAKQLEKQRGLELLELYNNSHRQIANIWGNEQFKQGRFNEKGELVDEMVGVSGTPAAVSAPKPNPKPADPLGVL